MCALDQFAGLHFRIVPRSFRQDFGLGRGVRWTPDPINNGPVTGVYDCHVLANARYGCVAVINRGVFGRTGRNVTRRHRASPSTGDTLSSSKRNTQQEKLAAVSRLLTAPSASDPLTISWAAVLLRRLAGARLGVEQLQVHVLQGLREEPEQVNDRDFSSVVRGEAVGIRLLAK